MSYANVPLHIPKSDRHFDDRIVGDRLLWKSECVSDREASLREAHRRYRLAENLKKMRSPE
ncbi:hypothetical protein LC605_03130 [Nostoc sp. CHAB 5836]|uniref:hypothetical protein n=1 Tax=Nostoc sp. CHAB 5836 TaxID=2780404 RepID=UPI001E502C2B|nr:hypothetical protein [Nostoc sp. CHAB 5836]MCC5614085.1 hypothetical protein [Nostoc sp. CHAB 5836]